MKAAVLEEVGAPLVMEELDVGEPMAHEVLVDVKACGLCHSDLHFIDGTYPHPMPVVPGHEVAGVVRAVGSEVARVKPGDHVVTCFTAYCGHCEFCVTGRITLCQSAEIKRGKGEPPRLSFAGTAKPVRQLLNLGGFAETMLVHESSCVPIRADMPMDRAALLGCAVATGASAVFNACRIEPGQAVAVIGCGGVGLAAINAARIAGAGVIVAADPLAEKRELALEMGASHAVDASADDAAEAIVRHTDGGAHHAIEAVGVPAAADLAVACLRRGGTATVLGMMPPGHKVGLGALDLLADKRLQGAFLGDARFPLDVPRLVDFYLSGALHLDRLIAERIGLEDINAGFDTMRAGASARSVIVFGE